MYIMSWVGIAATISLVIDVLILLQSLADSLASVNLDHLPLGFHTSLLATLDDGVTTISPGCLLSSYTCDWWRHSREPDPGRILGIDTLDECLDQYRQYIPSPAPSSTHSDSQPVPDPPRCQANCHSCINLRALIHDMFDEAHSMYDFLNSCESSADAALNANVRKAAGFHGLHELALV